jgi:hypothetical protein
MSWLSRAQAAAPSKRVFCNVPTEDVAGGAHATTTTTLVPPSPVINGFRPFFGGVGGVVHITGRYLCNATVTINGTTAEVFLNTYRRIGVTVPVGATTGPIRVTTPEGTIASAGSYTVTSTSGRAA